jgi:hypothetical protein
VRVLSKEKAHLERELREKDTKIKQLSGTAGKLELASKKPLGARDKQLDILAMKLVP